MKNKENKSTLGAFAEGKGFYMILLLCVLAIGVSSYYLFDSLLSAELVTITEPEIAVSQPVEVEVPYQVTILPDLAQEEELEEEIQPEEALVDEEVEESQATVFTWPVRGIISSEYSLEVFAYDETMGDWRVHKGLDIDCAVGTQVLALTQGTVSAVYEDELMGMTVIIDHGSGLESIYCNLAENPTVKVGDAVTTGTVIGSVGTTAIAESKAPSHLHFEVKQDGENMDPVAYLPAGQ